MLCRFGSSCAVETYDVLSDVKTRTIDSLYDCIWLRLKPFVAVLSDTALVDGVPHKGGAMTDCLSRFSLGFLDGRSSLSAAFDGRLIFFRQGCTSDTMA